MSRQRWVTQTEAAVPCPGKGQTLTERERRFIEAYMGKAAGNGTKAAILAGYSPKTAAQQAHENLRKPKIAAAVQQRVAADPDVANRERRQRFWTAVMDDVTVSWRDRLRASELLGRTQGDLAERHQVEHRFDPVEYLASLTPPKP